MKDLYLQLKNIKRKKDRGNGIRNSFMANLSEKQKKLEVSRHGDEFGKVT